MEGHCLKSSLGIYKNGLKALWGKALTYFIPMGDPQTTADAYP